MIVPALKDEAFLADLEGASFEGVHIWWLGQMGYLVQHEGVRVVFDPYLSDSLTRKYAETEKPHERMTEIVVDPARLPRITVVTTSHNHTDHLDAETLLPLLGANPEAAFVHPAPNREFIERRLGGLPARPIGLELGQTHAGEGWSITSVPAAHEVLSPHCVGYILRLGGVVIYHAGDTIPYEGMGDTLRQFGVDVALLPINGRLPERKVDGNLWGDEAAILAKAIGARVAIPGHYELFTFNTEPPDLFVATCEANGQGFRVLRAGERFTL